MRNLVERLTAGRTERLALLPLRLFVAIVFLDGGISKIADRRFLDSASATSMHASVEAVRGISPLGGLLDVVADHSTVFGVVMAIGEIAVGLGILLGLLTRVAAVGGMLLSLSLWLTVSWGAEPWFTSADQVYLFAFTPLLIAGPGPLSVDAWLASAATASGAGGASVATPAREARSRRVFVVAATALLGGVLLGAASLFRRDPAPTPRQAAPTPGSDSPGGSSTAPSGDSPGGSPAATAPAQDLGKALVPAAQVPVGGAVEVDDPTGGGKAWVLQPTAGRFTCLGATCPHQGCEVKFESLAAGFACPCHGSRFAADGSLVQGPATRGLAAIAVTVADWEVRAG